MVRSRAKQIDEGERPTNYFCGLKSQNFASKIIPKVEKEDGTIINDQFEILNEVKSFYEKLYTKSTSHIGEITVKKNINRTKLTHFLSKVKIIDNPDYFCHTETETVQHLMWNCNFVKTLIENYRL